MTCAKCHFEFCWICSKDWNRHGERSYECNRYKEIDQSNKTRAQSALRRYLFHYERYSNHANSLKLQPILHEKVQTRVLAMQNNCTIGFAESQLFDRALSTLEDCRIVLMHTYIYAFYVKKNNHLEIFEDNQRDLEIAVEKLCSYLEQEDHCMDIMYMKNYIQDLTKYCSQRKQVLIDHVEDGNAMISIWEYNEIDCN